MPTVVTPWGGVRPRAGDGRRQRRLMRRRPPKPVEFGAHRVSAIGAIEPAHGEMATRLVLEMLDESEVDRGAADRADHRDRLRRQLLGNEGA